MTTTSSDRLLRAEDIVVTFGGVTALSGVTLSVGAGQLVGLVGPNGAGKSTLFGVCSGLVRARSGRVALSGVDVTAMAPQRRARLGLARTFQHPEVFAALSVRQHLTLAYRSNFCPSRLWKDMFTLGSLRRPDANEAGRVDFLLDLLGLGEYADTSVSTLPLGTIRLVEVGRALACGPKIVLLDEPMSGLDAHEAARLARALRRTVDEEGTSLLLVEHDVDMVLRLCTNIVVLDFGEVIAEGEPDHIRSDPFVKKAYLGEELDETVPISPELLISEVVAGYEPH